MRNQTDRASAPEQEWHYLNMRLITNSERFSNVKALKSAFLTDLIQALKNKPVAETCRKEYCPLNIDICRKR